MLRRSILSILAVFLVAGCSTIQVKSNYNPKTDFSGLKTYSWLHDVDKPSDDERINNQLVVETVRTAVDKDLQAKGFQKDNTGQPDFVIAWFGAIEQKVRSENIDHFYKRYGYGAIYRDPYWNTQPTTFKVGEYEEGSLIFDFLDPRDHKLIWRGVGSDRIKKDQSENQVKSNLNAAVTQILAGFPPP